MEILSILGMFILLIVVLSFGKILSHALRFLFFALVVIFVLIFFFGISFNDVAGWTSAAVMWFF